MSLQDFIKNYSIDTDAMGKIKKRIFVVGRFNLAEGLTFNLFTMRKDLSEEYKRNFNWAGESKYENFVKVLRPAIAERLTPKQGDAPPMIELILPSEEANIEQAFILDKNNYFHVRAVSNSDQPRYAPEQRGGNENELLQPEERERGRGILRQIRRNLKAFSLFQHRVPELVEGLAMLLGRCGSEHELPAYAYAGPLPEGLREAMLDYLYAESVTQTEKVDLRKVTFSGDWESLQNNEKGRNTLSVVIEAYRDALINPEVRNHGDYRFKGKTLDDHAHGRVSKDLRTAFLESRAAFNQLRQLMRSKVLLSMVAEWVISSLDDLPGVREIPKENEDERNRMISTAILVNNKDYGWQDPIRRPSKDERKRFAKELSQNFERLITTVLIENESDFAVAKKQLGREMANVADEFRARKDLCQALRLISGKSVGDEQQYYGFIEANKTLLMDILCPTLFRSPIMTYDELLKLFEREQISAFITAILLTKENRRVIGELADAHYKELEKRIVGKDKIDDMQGMIAILLRDYVPLISNKNMAERVAAMLQAFKKAAEVARAGGADAEHLSLSDFLAIFSPNPQQVSNKPAIDSDKLEKQVKKVAEDRIIIQLKREAEMEHAAVVKGGPGQHPEPAGDRRVAPPEPDADVDDERAQDEAEKEEIAEIIKMARKSTPQELAGEERDRVVREKATDEFYNRHGEEYAEAMELYRQGIQKIYEQYNLLHGDLPRFANQVERMTLTNLMLLFRKDLALGSTASNLYKLILDLVMYSDPDNPSPEDFLRSKSLTEYWNNEQLEENGITQIRQLLQVQAINSLNNVVGFVSELRGMQFLLENAQSDAEIIVVNGTASEFLNWLKEDNLSQGQARKPALLKCGKLVRGEQSAYPSLIYMTDIAFAFEGSKDSITANKGRWIAGLANLEMSRGALSYILPPVCISTDAQDEKAGDVQPYAEHGRRWAEMAANAPTPILIIGPSPHLNRQGDIFKTVLPAGYLFSACLLGGNVQGIGNRMVGQKSRGRFQVIGTAPEFMDRSLDRIMWGDRADASPYSFAGDFYLYIILALIATAHGTGIEEPDIEAYSPFYNRGPVDMANYKKAAESLHGIVIGGNALRFAFGNNIRDDKELRELFLDREVADPEKNRTLPTIKDVNWFNLARKKIGVA